MDKKELEKIRRGIIGGTFLLFHLIEHHNFSKEEAKNWVAKLSTKLYEKDEELNEVLKKSLPNNSIEKEE